MRADVLARYVEPLLGEGFEHIQTIRIGTKSLSYWPYRYLTDDDADPVAAPAGKGRGWRKTPRDYGPLQSLERA